MALFIDGGTPAVQDLLEYDRNVLSVASGEGLDCESKIVLARSEVLSELEDFLTGEGSSHGVASVVATEPLRRWTAMGALALFYRDAHYHQWNDRYRAKWQEYRELANEARRLLFERGVACVLGPIRRPAKPAVEVIGGTAEAGSYYFQVSFVKAGEEGEASEMASVAVNAASGFRIEVADAPAQVTGWNVYAGSTDSDTELQNAVPLSLGEAWTHTGAALLPGRKPPTGQEPGAFVRRRNILRRG